MADDELRERITDAVESTRWQDLANSLNALQEWGLWPVFPPRPIEAHAEISAGIRAPGEGYFLRFVPTGSEELVEGQRPGWTVFPRSTLAWSEGEHGTHVREVDGVTWKLRFQASLRWVFLWRGEDLSDADEFPAVDLTGALRVADEYIAAQDGGDGRG